MKIGINLVGIYKGGRTNYNSTKKSLMNNVINCWDEKPNIYLTTYSSDEDNDLINFYNPIKYQFLEFDKSSQRKTNIKNLEQLKDEDVDFIISTRFDIDFHKKISNFNIDYNKINFLFRESPPNTNQVCDVIFCYPKKYLIPFMISLIDLSKSHTSIRRRNPSFNRNMHAVNKFLEKYVDNNNINFMVDGYYLSHSNNFYKIVKN